MSLELSAVMILAKALSGSSSTPQSLYVLTAFLYTFNQRLYSSLVEYFASRTTQAVCMKGFLFTQRASKLVTCVLCKCHGRLVFIRRAFARW